MSKKHHGCAYCFAVCASATMIAFYLIGTLIDAVTGGESDE